MAEFTVEAVVLRRSDSGESDRRLTLLTREHGKLDAIAKGARKGGSRLAGASEPLVLSTMQLAKGRVRRFVTQAQPQTSFPGLRLDFERLAAGLALAELVAVSTPFEAGESDVFDLLVGGLEALEASPEWLPAMVWAEVRLMREQGVLPVWTQCVATGEPLKENPAWVSPIAGGYLSIGHAERYGDRFQASAEALIGLNKIVELGEPPLRLKRGEECLRILHAFWVTALESELPAHRTLTHLLPAPAE